MELAAFLKARRARIERAALGLPPARGGSTDGASREEVAVLAGMSVTWYTWLEQARTMNPSRQVLDALGRVFLLSASEHAYLLELAGYASQQLPVASTTDVAPEHLQRLVDGMPGLPAFVLAADWTIVGWNQAYERLYPSITAVAPADRNLLRLVFTDPGLRRLLPRWEDDARHFVAEFRAEVGAQLGDAAYIELVQSLSARSEEFAAVWQDHEVQRFNTRLRRFRHPTLGELVLEHNRLLPSDGSGAHLVVYTSAPGTGTDEKLAALVA